ncbi:MAG: glycosyltransferase [Bacteroidetes bacterium]|jgi:cellulose synthase/poly-beta-1,6-N-acetylglucosamine synthase-like glycosyltransferase|nr:glycosyltransferase [Bacteroidota bacterium]
MPALLAVVALGLNLHYAFQFMLSFWAWKRLPRYVHLSEVPPISFSIIVALRNEADNVQHLLRSLASLSYPAHLVEFVLVDDHSTDQTMQIVAQEAHALGIAPRLKTIDLASMRVTHQRNFKKIAVQIGVRHAANQWVVTTDADCTFSPGYLGIMAAFIGRYAPKFISAPVTMYPARTWFERMQALEFQGLVGLGAAYIQRDKPYLCNGANLAFPRDVYESLNGYNEHPTTESGEDIWFMHKVQDRYPFELYFALHPQLVVTTPPCPSPRAFLEQRKRWTSKNAGYDRPSLVLTLALDYLYYVCILVLALAGFFTPGAWSLLALMLATKALVETIFYLALQRDLPSRQWALAYLLAFFPQILYVVAILPLSKLQGYQWKNRKFRD